MRCVDAMDRLRDGGAPAAEAARHLEACASCRRAWDEERALVEALRAIPAPDPGAGHGARFRRAVRGRLAAEPVARRAGASRPALLAVAALVIAAAGLVVAFRPDGLTAPDPGTTGALAAEIPSIPELVHDELEDLIVESWSETLDAGDGTRAWAAALTGDMDWISSLTDEDQLALLMALEEDPA